METTGQLKFSVCNAGESSWSSDRYIASDSATQKTSTLPVV